MEKLTMYLAGITENVRHEMVSRFPFDSRELPVRYLGLPLVTKRMTLTDYLPLLEQLMSRIGSWTSRFFSFAGILNILSSVLWSISNFWLAAFRLPRECIREIEKMCSAFLWSRSDLNPRKAKIAWEVVCKPKQEGRLGLRSLKEANDVCCLKLIWKLISHKPSLWGTWVKTYLIKLESFWSIRENTSLGSWIWKKLLKYREVAKNICKVEIRSGISTSFWYDRWSSLGCLMDITGLRGIIDMGISKNATVPEAWNTRRRRRRHRGSDLNSIEDALALQQQSCTNDGGDVVLWRGKGDAFKQAFSTKDTWNHTRTTSNKVAWHKGVWFAHATPKYSFCTWLAMHNHLLTGDRMANWNVGETSTCVLCRSHMKTRDHIFFACSYSSEIWIALATNIFQANFSVDWQTIVNSISTHKSDRVHYFLRRYAFQEAIHSVWRERNARKHEEDPSLAARLIKFIDKQVRNQLLSIRAEGDKRYETGLQAWFASRS